MYEFPRPKPVNIPVLPGTVNHSYSPHPWARPCAKCLSAVLGQDGCGWRHLHSGVYRNGFENLLSDTASSHPKRPIKVYCLTQYASTPASYTRIQWLKNLNIDNEDLQVLVLGHRKTGKIKEDLLSINKVGKEKRYKCYYCRWKRDHPTEIRSFKGIIKEYYDSNN